MEESLVVNQPQAALSSTAEPSQTSAQRYISITHLSSEHNANDIRIFQKEAATLVSHAFHPTVIAIAAEDTEISGVRIKAIPRARNRFQRMTATAFRVFWSAWETPSDIYQIHDPELLPWGQLLRLKGKPVVFDMHENLPGSIRNKPWIRAEFRAGLAKLWEFLQRILLSGMSVVFAEKSYASEFRFIPRSTIVMNMPLIDELLSISEHRHKVPTIGYFGNVTAQRGSINTLQALHQLQEQGVRVDWDCIGALSAAHKRELESFIHDHQIEGVRLIDGGGHGYVPPEEGWRALARCHIGLAVLDDIPNYRASYPTKLFEYMALGMPVIVSDFPLYRAIVEDAACGICVRPSDPTQLAEAIRWLITHPENAKCMGDRGREAARSRYSWDREKIKLVEFYQSLVAA